MTLGEITLDVGKSENEEAEIGIELVVKDEAETTTEGTVSPDETGVLSDRHKKEISETTEKHKVNEEKMEGPRNRSCLTPCQSNNQYHSSCPPLRPAHSAAHWHISRQTSEKIKRGSFYGPFYPNDETPITPTNRARRALDLN